MGRAYVMYSMSLHVCMGIFVCTRTYTCLPVHEVEQYKQYTHYFPIHTCSLNPPICLLEGFLFLCQIVFCVLRCSRCGSASYQKHTHCQTSGNLRLSGSTYVRRNNIFHLSAIVIRSLQLLRFFIVIRFKFCKCNS